MSQDGIHLELRPQKNMAVTWREYQRGVLTETGVAMNPTAAYVFKQCDGERTLAEIVEAYQETYGLVPDAALDDVLSVVRELEEQKILLTE